MKTNSAYDNIILGENCVFSSNCDETQLNNNILVVGSSGCGKTMSVSEPRLLNTENSNLIITISKRKLYYKYKPLLIERGYNVLDLNFVSPEESDVGYDPLAYVEDANDMAFLAQNIVNLDPRKERCTKMDPYWDEISESLVVAIASLAKWKDKRASFSDVLDLHHRLRVFDGYGSQIATSLDDEFDVFIKECPDSAGASAWNSFRQLPMKTAMCSYSSLNVVIDTIFSDSLKEMMRKPSVDFRKLANEKTVLFVTTSAVNPSLNAFVNMFYSQAIKSLFEYAELQPDGSLPIPTHLLCDDFAVGAPINRFHEFISIMREKKISATILLQSESQLEAMYGSDKSTTIINNCDSYVFLGGMDLRTCKNVSEKLNIPLDEVLYMPIGTVALFRRGQRPCMTKRYNILENNLYKKITKNYETLKKSPKTKGENRD